MSEKRRQELIQVCEKEQLPIIEDEPMIPYRRNSRLYSFEFCLAFVIKLN